MPYASAIVLAAGESTRMGTQKALLPWNGTTLIADQLAQLSSIDDVRQIIVVTGFSPEPIRQIASGFSRAQCVHNDAYAAGKVSSIKTGISVVASEARAIVLIAVDQPRPAAIMESLLAHHLAAGALITVPVQGGRRGHPLIFASELLPELQTISEETQGVRALMRDPARIQEVEVEDAIVHLDLNTPSDLER